jgi:hypothetical protein
MDHCLNPHRKDVGYQEYLQNEASSSRIDAETPSAPITPLKPSSAVYKKWALATLRLEEGVDIHTIRRKARHSLARWHTDKAGGDRDMVSIVSKKRSYNCLV